jgi:hypothetical protein
MAVVLPPQCLQVPLPRLVRSANTQHMALYHTHARLLESVHSCCYCSRGVYFSTEAAKAHGVTIVGGTVPERRGEKFYNTCCVYGTQGTHVVYCGAKLVRMTRDRTSRIVTQR